MKEEASIQNKENLGVGTGKQIKKELNGDDFVPVIDPSLYTGAALAAARRAIPRVRVLHKEDPNSPAIIFLVGCQGIGSSSAAKSAQELVAELMDRIAKEGPPDVIFFLGDNLYPSGAKSPADESFIKYFYEMYGKRFPHLAKVPGILILGNHDGDYDWQSYAFNKPTGKEIEINEVAHTYMPDEQYISVTEKEKLFASPDLYLPTAPKWIMPHYYDSYILDDMQFFCLNSNSYVLDYVNLRFKPNDPETFPDNGFNQAQWIAEQYHLVKGCDILWQSQKPTLASLDKLPNPTNAAYIRTANQVYYVDKIQKTCQLVIDKDAQLLVQFDQALSPPTTLAKPYYRLTKQELNDITKGIGHTHPKTAGRKAIFLMHQGPLTPGKRAKESDAHYYKLKTKENVSHNQLLATVLKEQEIDAVALYGCAHDHMAGFINNALDPDAEQKISQLIVGNGGQKPQAWESFKEYIKTCLPEHGFAILRKNPKDKNDLLINIKTLSGHDVIHSLKSHEALVNTITDKSINTLRDAILKICDDYLINLREEEKINYPPKKVNLEELVAEDKNSYLQKGINFFSDSMASGAQFMKKTFAKDEKRAKDILVIQNLLAYLNQPNIPGVEAIVNYVQETIAKYHPHPGDHSLYKHLEEQILKNESFCYLPDAGPSKTCTMR